MFVGSEYYDNLDNQKKASTGDILYSVVGSFGKPVYIDNDNEFVFQRHIAILRPNKEKVDNKYLYYFLLSPYFYRVADKLATGCSQRTITLDSLRNLEVELHDKNYQKLISKHLSIIDKKIDVNNAINTELEKMAKLLYNYWFVQFDFPDENGKPYRSSGGEMVFNEQLKREIPKGWEVSTIRSFIKTLKSGDWGNEQANETFSEKVHCIRAADYPFLYSGSNIYPPVRYIMKNKNNRKLVPGDLIVEISGGSPTQSTGRICYINEGVLKRFHTDIITSNFCRALTLNDTSDMYYLFLHWSRLHEAGIMFNYEGKTTGIRNLLLDEALESLKTVIIPDKIKNDFNKHVSKLFDKIQMNNLENYHLASHRDFLLPLLMNGQVTVGR